MPRETPQGITSRTPPNNCESENPSRCASRSQMASSSAALAMWLPRTRRKVPGHSPPCSGEVSASIGPQFLEDDHPGAVSPLCRKIRLLGGSALAPAVSPSDWISASRTRRLRVTPKLVSKGRTSGMCSSRRMTASILIGPCNSLGVEASCGREKGPSSKTPFPCASRTKPSTARPWENAC